MMRKALEPTRDPGWVARMIAPPPAAIPVPERARCCVGVTSAQQRERCHGCRHE
jgi:hypothetical protein